MALWADWVRASVYLGDFLRDLDWTVSSSPESVTVGYRVRDPKSPAMNAHVAKPVCTLHRPSIADFEAQLTVMRNYLDQRPDRSAEIMTQLGFPTPYFAMVLGLQGALHKSVFELITITQVLCAHVAMTLKHHLACIRPDRIGAKIMPIIPTPAHGAFPSAHATEAFAAAEVLNGLIEGHYADVDKRRKLISKLAERIAVSRTVAGVHYPIDSWAGAVLGRCVGQIVLAKCGARTTVDGHSYKAVAASDFYLSSFLDSTKAAENGVTQTEAAPIGPSGVFQWLWGKASEELSRGRPQPAASAPSV
jgi:membrane-associated phospholipid phosphatase